MGEILSGWKSGKPYARIERQAFAAVAGGRHAVNTPDKANANYMAGQQIAMSDREPDFPALLLGNYVFGGSSLASRLGDRVRQREGLSYGVSSSLNSMPEDQLTSFWIGAICNPGNIGKVETAIREELDKLLKDGIAADEFEKARRGLLESRQRARNSDAYIVNRLARSLRTDQTLEYEAQVDGALAAFKPAEVLAVLKKRIDSKRLVIVVAGDFEARGAN
jgi:zinc protease